ncbi:MAG: hypothetical protein GX447_08050 [Elusimicrobia bacterium]|nr:hypothetical protein [Elusimicrobiota bacterium]
MDRIRFFILTKILKKNHSKLIFDFDDAVFLKPFNSCEDIIRNADAVFAGSHYLLEYAKKNNNNSFLIPTPVDLPKAFPVKREKNIFKIGWLGSESNFKYLYEIEDELYKALNSFDSQLLIMSSSEPNFKKIAFKFFKWGIEEERFFLEELHAGIMPLSQGEWEKGKCAYKVLKYMSYGAVPLATAFGENIFVIKDGFSGFLIRKKEDWFFYLNFLYSNRTQMEKMSAYAYEEAKNFSREKIVFLQAEILKKI